MLDPRQTALLRRALPLVRGLATKVNRVHGGRNAKLAELDAAVLELHDTLWPYLEPTLEHEPELTELLVRIRRAADDFRVPDWACGSYRMLFTELAYLDEHVVGPRATSSAPSAARPPDTPAPGRS